MTVPTYLKERRERSSSKNHVIQKSISSRYKFIKENLFSRFHDFRNQDTSEVDQSTLDFLIKYESPLLQRSKQLQKNSSQKIALFAGSDKSFSKECLDWTRGRFQGEVISIIVKKISECVYN